MATQRVRVATPVYIQQVSQRLATAKPIRGKPRLRLADAAVVPTSLNDDRVVDMDNWPAILRPTRRQRS